MSFIRSGVAAAAALAFAGAAQADVPWDVPSGNASFFSWDNGGSTNGLFGSPTVVGDTFFFFPSNFTAQSANGGSDMVTDTVSFDLTAFSGYKFTSIVIQEVGDYSLVGSGGSVNATGMLTISDLDAPRSIASPILTTPTMPVTTPGAATWQGQAGVDMVVSESGLAWTHIHVSFENNLFTIAGPDGSARITKAVVGEGIAVTILPAPSAAALLGLGGLAAVRRRRA